MDKPKILIATATRNPDGTFTIADDEEDILVKYPSAVYNELSGMESYGEPRTYTEEYAEEPSADVFLKKGYGTSEFTMKLYFFGTLEEITAQYHSLMDFLAGRCIRLSDNIRKRKMILVLSNAVSPSEEKLYGVTHFSVSYKFTNLYGRSFDLADNSQFK